jgi:hypothetical protein
LSELAASTFSAEDQAKHETSVKQVTSTAVYLQIVMEAASCSKTLVSFQ